MTTLIMVIFDGNFFAEEKTKVLSGKVDFLKKKGIVPKLVSILIGNNPESQLYLALKGKKAKQQGINFELITFKNNEDSGLIIEQINKLNSDESVQGIMVQLPLPERYQENKEEILSVIDPQKDVDCLTPTNLGFLLMGDPRIIPATPKAVLQIVQTAICHSELSESESEESLRGSFAGAQDDRKKKWLTGKDVCVVGASNLVGKPLAMMLSNLGATVTICRSTTKNLTDFTKEADILISAVGKAGLIIKEMVKPGAIVIDVGITNIKEPYGKTRILGDVAKDVKEVAGFFTPVPGGVGPVTIVCLLENLVDACEVYV